MKATLDALDERLHGLLTRPCGRAARIVCAALTTFGFALVMATRTLALGHPMATAAAKDLPPGAAQASSTFIPGRGAAANTASRAAGS